jgi:Trk K+ transport system NAD-binding subunit
VPEREALAQEARSIPGSVNVRALLTGRRNLHALAVGENTTDPRRLARALSKLGIETEDEDLVREEIFDAYAPFGPDERAPTRGPTDVISLAGDTEVVEMTVRSDAPIVGRSLAEAVDDGILESDALVIAIERDDQVLTPHGSSVVESDDVVTLLSRKGDAGTALSAFLGEDHARSSP